MACLRSADDASLLQLLHDEASPVVLQFQLTLDEPATATLVPHEQAGGFGKGRVAPASVRRRVGDDSGLYKNRGCAGPVADEQMHAQFGALCVIVVTMPKNHFGIFALRVLYKFRNKYRFIYIQIVARVGSDAEQDGTGRDGWDGAVVMKLDGRDYLGGAAGAAGRRRNNAEAGGGGQCGANIAGIYIDVLFYQRRCAQLREPGQRERAGGLVRKGPGESWRGAPTPRAGFRPARGPAGWVWTW